MQFVSEFNQPDWNQIPTIVASGVTAHESGSFKIESDQGPLYLSLVEMGVRLSNKLYPCNRHGLLVHSPKPARAELTEITNGAIIENANYRVKLTLDPLGLELSVLADQGSTMPLRNSNDGHFERKHRIPPFARVNDGWLVSLALESEEPIYGLGEKWGKLNKRGQLLRSFNHDALGVNAEISYKNTPFAWSPRGWGLFTHCNAPVVHAVGHASWSQRSYCSLLESQDLDLFFLLTANATNPGVALIKAYTDLTGRAPIPPDWSAGVILSKAYYKDAEEILSVAREVREKNIPCEVITFDGRAWQDTDTRFNFEFCEKRYPNPQQVIDKLKALDFKICVWEYPLISKRHELYQLFASNGWFVKDKRTQLPFDYAWDQQAFGKVLTPLPISGIVDFTHPDAYAFWRDKHKSLFDMGVDMIKADFGEQIEDPNMVAHDGSDSRELHNVYAHLYNRCVFEAAERYSKNGPFLFSRVGWTGCQRYNSQWGGDPQSDWEGMLGNIRGGLSWGLSGAPFYATDIGGFYQDQRDSDLYVRWAQNAIFSAHYRLHGIGNREPWSYGQPAEQYATEALQLRARLKPYILKTYEQAHNAGLPTQRPMVLAFPDQPQSWNFENQFMFGDELLVAPCGRANGQVDFYLPDIPEGYWQRWSPDTTDTIRYEAGRFYSEAFALNEIPVFIAAGRSIELA